MHGIRIKYFVLSYKKKFIYTKNIVYMRAGKACLESNATHSFTHTKNTIYTHILLLHQNTNPPKQS